MCSQPRRVPTPSMRGVFFLQSFDIVVHPSCTRTIDELATYSYEVDRKTDEVLGVLADKDNNLIDSMRYALETARRSTYDSCP